MGLIKAAMGAAGGVLADQWKEYFYCEAIPSDVLAVKGKKKVTGRSSNTKGDDNIITNGSLIAIADGQCMLIVEQGKVVDVCAEPGEYTYDMSTEPSIFSGDLGESVKNVFQNIGKRFTFGGEAPKDQRVYYFNTKELTGNKYGTPSPVPFRVVDQRAGIDIDIGIRCFGEYSIRLKNPLLFYTNVCGNVSEDYKTENIAGQMKTELLTALQPAFAKISEMGIRYSALPGHTLELADALNEQLSSKWRDLRGMEIVSFGVSSVKANEEDEQMIKELQRNAAFMDPTRAAAHLVGSQGEAMKAAAANTGAGPAMAFMGMGMAGQMGGMNAQNLFQMGQQQQAQQQAAQPAPAPAAQGWTCTCGQSGITGNFCPNCGSKKPEPKPAGDSWQCACGATATGKFCPECGKPKPAAAADGWTCAARRRGVHPHPPAATRSCHFITTFSKRKAIMTPIPARCSTPPPSAAPSRCAATKATCAPTSSRCFSGLDGEQSFSPRITLENETLLSRAGRVHAHSPLTLFFIKNRPCSIFNGARPVFLSVHYGRAIGFDDLVEHIGVGEVLVVHDPRFAHHAQIFHRQCRDLALSQLVETRAARQDRNAEILSDQILDRGDIIDFERNVKGLYARRCSRAPTRTASASPRQGYAVSFSAAGAPRA